MKNIINYSLLFFMGIIAAFIVYGTYLYAWDQNPAMVINNDPMALPVDKKQYRAGDTIFATADFCRYTSVPVTVYVSFADGLIYNLPTVTASGGALGCHVAGLPVAVVPAALPPGRYYIIGKSEFTVNILATRIIEWRTQKFDVIP